MIGQNKTTATAICGLVFKTTDVPASGEVIGFTYQALRQPTGLINVTVTVTDETQSEVLEALKTQINGSNNLYKWSAEITTERGIEVLEVRVDEGNEIDWAMEIDVISGDDKLAIEYFLPESFAWCEESENINGNIIRDVPTVVKNQYGWVRREKPALQWWNYMLNITGNFGNYIEKVAPRWKNILDEAISVINDLTPRVEALESDVEDIQNDIDNLPDFDGGALTFEVFIGGDNAGVQVAGAWSRTGNIVTVAMEELIDIEDTTLSGIVEVIATTSSILDVLKPTNYFPLGLSWFKNNPVGLADKFDYCAVVPNSDNKNAPTAAFQPAFKLASIDNNDPTTFVTVSNNSTTNVQITPTTFSWSTDAVP